MSCGVCNNCTHATPQRTGNRSAALETQTLNSFCNRRQSLRPYSWAALLFSGALTAVVLAACGGGSTTSPVTNFTPQSVALSTSAPLSATALAQQPVATSVPAPAG